MLYTFLAGFSFKLYSLKFVDEKIFKGCRVNFFAEIVTRGNAVQI